MSEVLIALAGNQNCGKTTLFNRLTGSNQHVGNFPGVTVERQPLSIFRAFILYRLIRVKKLSQEILS